MALIESFGGLLLVLGSILILRAAWRADVGDARLRHRVARPQPDTQMELFERERAA